jgi:hypothetical protein
MYTLIDCTNKFAIARHAEYKALAALAYIQFANVETTIVPLGENKGFAQFEHDELVGIGRNLGIKVPAATASNYGATIKQVRAAIESAENLELPFGLDKLMYQANSIHPDCMLPRAFDPSDGINVAKFVARWCVGPQENRARKESTYGSMFGTLKQPVATGGSAKVTSTKALPGRKVGESPDNSSASTVPAPPPPASMPRRLSASPTHTKELPMPNDVIDTAAAPAKKTRAPKAAPAAPAKAAPKKPAKDQKAKATSKAAVKAAPKAPAKPAGKPTAPAKPAKAGKAPAKAANGAKAAAGTSVASGRARPKEGSVGALIWGTADALLAKKGAAPSFQDVAAKLGEKVAEASLRTGYQRWRKFNNIPARAGQ